MAKHVWSVLCYKGAIHERTNQISLLDVIEQITIVPQEKLPEELKAVPLKVNMELVSLWIRSDLSVPESLSCRVRLVAPEGSKHYAKVLQLDLKNYVRGRSTIQFDDIPFYGPGLYNFIVEQRHTANSKAQKWRIAARVPLEIQIGQARVIAKTSKRAKERRPEKSN